MSSGPLHGSQGREMLDGCPTCQDCKLKSWGSATSFVVSFHFPVFDRDRSKKYFSNVSRASMSSVLLQGQLDLDLCARDTGGIGGDCGEGKSQPPSQGTALTQLQPIMAVWE